MRRWKALAVVTAGVLVSGGCGAEEDTAAEAATEPEAVVLGPVDGYDLSPTDTGRVAVGTAAPDFTAASLAGPVWTLSDFRGEKNVVLFFYRGHW